MRNKKKNYRVVFHNDHHYLIFPFQFPLKNTWERFLQISFLLWLSHSGTINIHDGNIKANFSKLDNWCLLPWDIKTPTAHHSLSQNWSIRFEEGFTHVMKNVISTKCNRKSQTRDLFLSNYVFRPHKISMTTFCSSNKIKETCFR